MKNPYFLFPKIRSRTFRIDVEPKENFETKILGLPFFTNFDPEQNHICDLPLLRPAEPVLILN